MISLYELISKSAEAGHLILDERGAMPAGHNGPYLDPETPVRNTSHWLITFAKAYEITGHEKFLTAVQRTADYLAQPRHRPGGATFLHRQVENKDQCNGLIGQAWTIEALTVAADVLNRPDLYKLAEDVFLLHPFDEQVALWERVDPDGSELSFDRTFNHQLWFAATGGLLANQNNEIEQQIRIFLERLSSTLQTYESGLIRHPLDPDVPLLSYVKHPFKYKGLIANLVLNSARPPQRKKSLQKKSVGYHGFNLYALGMLKEQFPRRKYWQNPIFERTLSYVQTDEFREQIAKSDIAYTFNPVGFEIAFAQEAFDNTDSTSCKEWVSEQLDRSFDFDSMLMMKNAQDQNTLSARLYEATRLTNYQDITKF